VDHEALHSWARGVEVEEHMPITNFIRGLFAIFFLASTCHFCFTTSKNVNKNSTFTKYIVDRMEYLFIKIHIIKTIVITQP
jgi:hypothetical protein